ncbi:MAG: FAD:protein FMN transferase [Clostridium sp.]|jgi:thiamine biosynthesis lipoprotein|nr:FAD:protein FMN transferase [Clostridium sp.]
MEEARNRIFCSAGKDGHRKKWKRGAFFLWLCLAMGGLSACRPGGQGSAAEVRAEAVDVAMGTVVRQTVYLGNTQTHLENAGSGNSDPPESSDGNKDSDPKETGDRSADSDPRQTAEEIVAEVLEIITELETRTLSRRLPTAEVYRLNAEAANAKATDAEAANAAPVRESGADTVSVSHEMVSVEVSEALAAVLEETFRMSERSGGALDVTIGELTRLWGLDLETAERKSDYRPPTESQVEKALEHCGFSKVAADGNRVTLPRHMSLDLGAVGKGIAADEVAAYLKNRQEVAGAVVSIGGTILTYGEKPDQSPWKVGIVHPRSTGEYLGWLTLRGEWYVSTSGDYERYAEADGVRYHHLLDPKDGYPADSGVVSVTILCKNGLLSDSLSTACFVLGVENGLRLARECQAQALIVDTEGELHMTEGMEGLFSGRTSKNSE